MEKIFSLTKSDFEVKATIGSGPGGQHRNKVATAIRIVHKDSGCVGQSSSDKSQHRNKRLAFQRLIEQPKFKLWVQRRVHELTGGKSIDQRVSEAMQDNNIRVEVKDEKDRWVEHV